MSLEMYANFFNIFMMYTQSNIYLCQRWKLMFINNINMMYDNTCWTSANVIIYSISKECIIRLLPQNEISQFYGIYQSKYSLAIFLGLKMTKILYTNFIFYFKVLHTQYYKIPNYNKMKSTCSELLEQTVHNLKPLIKEIKI